MVRLRGKRQETDLLSAMLIALDMLLRTAS